MPQVPQAPGNPGWNGPCPPRRVGSRPGRQWQAPNGAVPRTRRRAAANRPAPGPARQADDAASLARTCLANRNGIIASAAALIAAVTTR